MTFFETTKTPKSIADCVEIDATAQELMTWAKNIRRIGEIISVILFLMAAVACGVDAYKTLKDTSYSSSITGPILAVCGLIVYATFGIISLHLGGKACMVQNTKVAAMIAVYKTGEELPIIGKCAFCGKTDVPLVRKQPKDDGTEEPACSECAEEWDKEHQ